MFVCRFCFIQSAYESGLLADPDYTALCQWYDWIEHNLDIGLDLIGSYIFLDERYRAYEGCP